MHLICDNYQTHKTSVVKAWLQNHLRFHMHFTATYSSWLNQVERFFSFVTEDLLRRSDHRSVQALESDIRKWISGWKSSPTPFTRTKTAEQILHRPTSEPNFSRRTLALRSPTRSVPRLHGAMIPAGLPMRYRLAR
ncbi:transposase [Pseudarthrobacter sp. NIBRBAC000502772]|uniref:transposase n=1 Tax=Pseudarthrobacter sp. NIBRBAC000502772 TaxID=2590775 RepID=UPI00143CCA4E|nr:transposase [Pseudarthrobacter sp. NIBRBAC000502772]